MINAIFSQVKVLSITHQRIEQRLWLMFFIRYLAVLRLSVHTYLFIMLECDCRTSKQKFYNEYNDSFSLLKSNNSFAFLENNPIVNQFLIFIHIIQCINITIPFGILVGVLDNVSLERNWSTEECRVCKWHIFSSAWNSCKTHSVKDNNDNNNTKPLMNITLVSTKNSVIQNCICFVIAMTDI